ncbi:MAG: hypothetical protein GY793_07535, partial [Proteobacteria bacterium]|nr:hypothetical protein [Pseudomonadota bacterium]
MKPLELKEIFGKKAIQTMCTEKTDELSTIIRQLNNELDKWYKKLASSKNEDSWWFESWIDMKK